MLEIGSWVGESMLAWRAAISKFCPKKGSILCLDPWQSYASQEDLLDARYAEMNKMLENETALAAFKHNLKFGDPNVFVSYIQGNVNAIATLPISFNLIYIDGSHYYKDVLKDIQAAKRLIAENGVICGDDLEWVLNTDDQQVRDAVGRNRDYVDGYHPGVTLAVWEQFGADIWCSDGFWMVQRAGSSEQFKAPKEPS